MKVFGQIPRTFILDLGKGPGIGQILNSDWLNDFYNFYAISGIICADYIMMIRNTNKVTGKCPEKEVVPRNIAPGGYT